MRLEPAPPGTGTVFVREDLPGSPAVPALLSAVVSSDRGTTLGLPGGARILTVEHLLAALAGAEIDDVLVLLDGPELPIGDGSARPYLDLIGAAGVAGCPGTREPLAVESAVFWERGESLLAAFPGEGLRVAAAVSFPRLPPQYLSLSLDPEVFRDEVAPARTFGMLEEAEALFERGLALGSGLENTVVLDGEVVISKEGLRFPDEFVRHKILDLVGDLALLGRPLRGTVVALRPGHAHNLALASKILEADNE